MWCGVASFHPVVCVCVEGAEHELSDFQFQMGGVQFCGAGRLIFHGHWVHFCSFSRHVHQVVRTTSNATMHLCNFQLVPVRTVNEKTKLWIFISKVSQQSDFRFTRSE